MSLLTTPIFGNGSDSTPDLVISSNLTDTPIDAAFTGTAGATTGLGTNASFAVGQAVFIHQSQGTGNGMCERNYITGYSAGTITFSNTLANTYTTGAQIIVIKQLRSLTVTGGFTWTAKAWNGTTGGILAVACSGQSTISGNISANSAGFRGASATTSLTIQNGKQGEGTSGPQDTIANTSNGTGGGGGTTASGGGGGGYGVSGNPGGVGSGGGSGGVGGSGGGGTADLTQMLFGGGGGGGASPDGGSTGSSGSAGGGIIVLWSNRINITGGITSNSASSPAGQVSNGGSGGTGAGGTISLYTICGSLGNNLITATPGTPSGAINAGGAGGQGAPGRIAISKGSLNSSDATNPTFTDRGYQTYCGTVGRG